MGFFGGSSSRSEKSYKEVWFRTNLLCCQRCPNVVEKYLSKKKHIEVDRFEIEVEQGCFYVEGNFDASEAARKLTGRLCESVTIDTERPSRDRASQRSVVQEDEMSAADVTHRRLLQEESARMRYEEERNATHRRILQEESARRRHRMTYYEDFAGSYKYGDINVGGSYSYAEGHNNYSSHGQNDYDSVSHSHHHQYSGYDHRNISGAGGHDYDNSGGGGGHDYGNAYSGDGGDDCIIM